MGLSINPGIEMLSKDFAGQMSWRYNERQHN